MLRSLVLLVTFPKVELVGSKLGALQMGWLNTLNASARNWKLTRSFTGIVLNSPMFQFWNPGPWIRSRTRCVLNVPAVGGRKIRSSSPPNLAVPSGHGDALTRQVLKY